jgi:UDP-3-O-acyl-N-acetylglucosamine deacetylase
MLSGKITKHIDRNLYKRNIIQFSNRIFIWEDKGRVIERLEYPIQKGEKSFFYKAYDAKNIIKLCKKVEYLENKECLLVSDEDKYVKILSYDDTNKKFKVEKEYFVSQYFGQNQSVATINGY